MRENVIATWRRVLFVLLAVVLALGTVPSRVLAEVAEEPMGEETAATEAATAQAGGAMRPEVGDMSEAPAPGGQVAPAAPEPAAPGPGLEPQSDEPASQGPDGEAAENELTAQSVSVRNPRVVANSSMSSGQVVTWDCVWLGSYPQTEVTAGEAAYKDLQAAKWVDDDATVGGVRYRRIAKYGTYRFFRYEPIKWRVLKVDGNTALAVADVALDCRPYHKSNDNVTWERSTVRSWLNGTGSAPYYSSGAQSGRTAQAFAEVAFTAEQLGAVRQSTIKNDDNTDYGTAGGNDTTDRVFLLSESEVCGESATAHGFVSDPYTYDEARRCKPTEYARAMGASVSTSGSNAGNCWWWLRSPGSCAHDAADVYYDGNVYRGGYHVDRDYCAVRPALNLNLSSPHLTWAGTVSSDDKTFPDVPATAWYAGVVGRAARLGLINGYEGGRFGPADNVTRGQVAVILWNMAGKPWPKGAAKSFPDVVTAKYYYDAVVWASSVGVVSGYKNGRFGPDDLVTREQLAAMLANYAGKVAGKDTSGSAADYKSMKDASKVSSWAAKSVGWCFKNGIISGTKDGRVNPQGNATRAETAKMVVFLHDML